MHPNKMLLMAAVAVAPFQAHAQADGAAKPPVATVIDTTMGQLRCRLFPAEKPATTAAFARFAASYDNARINGIAGGFTAGAIADPTGANKPLEAPLAMKFDRPGLLAMVGDKGNMSPRFMVLDHANAESDRGAASIFGECDAASIPVIESISHRLTTVDNDPATSVLVKHVAILHEGETMPKPPAVSPTAATTDTPVKPIGPEPTGPTAVFQTTMGNLSCRLFRKESPIAVSTFISLAEGTKDWTHPTTHALQHGVRYYDGIAFDRVIPDFMIQTGDITNDPSGKTDIGFRFPNENTPDLTYDRPGRLAFGNGGKDTNNSELFFTEHPIKRLNGGYTIIGQCDPASVRLIEAIARVPRDAHNRTLTPVVIQKVTIQK